MAPEHQQVEQPLEDDSAIAAIDISHADIGNMNPTPDYDMLVQDNKDLAELDVPDFSQASSADIERELLGGPQPSGGEAAAEVPTNIIDKQVISTEQHVDVARSNVMAALGEKVPQFDEPAESPLDSVGRHNVDEADPSKRSVDQIIADLSKEREQLASATPQAEAVGNAALQTTVEVAEPDQPITPEAPLTPHQEADQLLADLEAASQADQEPGQQGPAVT